MHEGHAHVVDVPSSESPSDPPAPPDASTRTTVQPIRVEVWSACGRSFPTRPVDLAVRAAPGVAEEVLRQVRTVALLVGVRLPGRDGAGCGQVPAEVGQPGHRRHGYAGRGAVGALVEQEVQPAQPSPGTNR